MNIQTKQQGYTFFSDRILSKKLQPFKFYEGHYKQKQVSLFFYMHFFSLLFFAAFLLTMNACRQEADTLLCAQGTVIGQGCLTGSYAIRLDRKNKEYGISENVTFDNVVETLNLPEEYQVNGTQIYFTFKKPSEEAGKYLTYCTSAPQVMILDISNQNCPVPVKNSR